VSLTYYDVVHADLSSLLDAANMWRKMGTRYGELHGNYRDNVRSLTGQDGAWTGGGSDVFDERSKDTLHEFIAAKKQANAVASLLEDAHGQFTTLKKKVEKKRDDAVAAGMKVDDNGYCTYDYSDYTSAEKRAAVQAGGFATEENEWTNAIRGAVKELSDADHGVKTALENVSKDRDEKGASGGFNSSAKGDVEKYEAQRSAQISLKLNSGEPLPKEELKELRRLLRDNKNDVAFSRTMLNVLGHEGTVKVANRLSELTHTGDSKARGKYRPIVNDLASVLDTATTVQGADKAEDRKYRDDWLEGMKKAGVKKYSLDISSDDDVTERVRGYQSVVTLMQQGGEYDAGFLHALADDIREVEDPKKGGNPNIWDLHGDYAGQEKKDGAFANSGKGWFANDPLDGILGFMSESPHAATAFFDPSTEEGKDRLEYLSKERDWKLIDHEPIVSEKYGAFVEGQPDTLDSDAHAGFGAALEAAMTGYDPQQNIPGYIPDHSSGEVRVLQEVISTYADITDSNQGAMPDGIRENMASALAYYPEDVYDILGKHGGYDSPANDVIAPKDGDLIQFIRAASEDGSAYKIIHDSQASVLAGRIDNLTYEDFTSKPQGNVDEAQGTVSEEGRVLGAIDRVRADVLGDHRDEEMFHNNWNAKIDYHRLGTPWTPLPVLGDFGQRMVDVATADLANSANAELQEKTQADLIDMFASEDETTVEKMLRARADEVGVTAEQGMQSGGRTQQLFTAGDLGYNSGLGEAERETGETE
jgi:hypothetical protein